MASSRTHLFVLVMVAALRVCGTSSAPSTKDFHETHFSTDAVLLQRRWSSRKIVEAASAAALATPVSASAIDTAVPIDRSRKTPSEERDLSEESPQAHGSNTTKTGLSREALLLQNWTRMQISETVGAARTTSKFVTAAPGLTPLSSAALNFTEPCSEKVVNRFLDEKSPSAMGVHTEDLSKVTQHIIDLVATAVRSEAQLSASEVAILFNTTFMLKNMVLPSITAAHEEDVSTIASAHHEVLKCREASPSVINMLTILNSSMCEANSLHAACRSEQKKLIELHPPTCARRPTKSKAELRRLYYEGKDVQQSSACKDASQELALKHASCNKLQKEFEQRFCAVCAHEGAVAKHRRECLSMAAKHLQAVEARAKKAAASRIVAHESIAFAMCHVDLLPLRNVTAQRRFLQNCQTRHVDNSRLQISTPTVQLRDALERRLCPETRGPDGYASVVAAAGDYGVLAASAGPVSHCEVLQGMDVSVGNKSSPISSV